MALTWSREKETLQLFRVPLHHDPRSPFDIIPAKLCISRQPYDIYGTPRVIDSFRKYSSRRLCSVDRAKCLPFREKLRICAAALYSPPGLTYGLFQL